MSTAAAALTLLILTKREIEVWKDQTLPLPKTNNPLREWCSGVQIFPWSSLLAQCVLVIPHTSASPERLFLPLVTPWPRNNAVCHMIILRNACIYMKPCLKSVSGPQTRRSSTWIISSLLPCFSPWPLFSEGAFCLQVTFVWCGINVFSWTWMTATGFGLVHTFRVSVYVVCVSPHDFYLWQIMLIFNSSFVGIFYHASIS